MSTAASPLDAWFRAQGWRPLPFQREVWRRYLAGESGLLHTPTGSGKTLAALGGPLLEALAPAGAGPRANAPRRTAAADTSAPTPAQPAGRARRRRGAADRAPRLLWITPLRALAADTVRALRTPVAALGLDWRVAMRTGDASARDKRLARSGQAEIVVATPESLALLLSYPDSAEAFDRLRCVVIDEWHELLGNKRGVLLQLCLARLRARAPALRTWGLSATLGNLDQARDVLLPHAPGSAIVSGVKPRSLEVETLLPAQGERFPWAGHLGLVQLERVMQRLLRANTSVLFTNTRAQAELWHRALAAVWPEAPETLALHHGSLDPSLRGAAEQGLRDGTIRCVVATSSLDLGVDFPAVDQVLQVGSPKGMARLLQRAGRARHRPGEAGHVACVPTHALELLEYAAARQALAAGRIEARPPPVLALDVLAQHCVTLALGGGPGGARFPAPAATEDTGANARMPGDAAALVDDGRPSVSAAMRAGARTATASRRTRAERGDCAPSPSPAASMPPRAAASASLAAHAHLLWEDGPAGRDRDDAPRGRSPGDPPAPLDSPGFAAPALLAEVRGTHAFAALDDTTWQAVLDFVVQGGAALSRYPDYTRVVREADADGVARHRVRSRKVAFRHRLNIGTIASDGALAVKHLKGGTLGSVEESFIGRLRPGDRFQFAGRTLELVRLQDMTAYVRASRRADGVVPKWQGGRMPLSGELGREVEALFDGPRDAPELRALAPLLALQADLSALPGPGRLLAEWIHARDGHHLFLYPFAGRAVHEGLASLMALRWGRIAANTFSFATNDYGLVLSLARQAPLDIELLRALLAPERLLGDLRAGLNLGELARRQFREVARVAGLLPPSLPGRAARSLRQLQASAGLLFDVLRAHDPGHLLLAQAEREVFAAQLEVERLAQVLGDCARRTLLLRAPGGFTPLSFPLWAESLRGQLSTEDWKTRVERAAARLERRHG